MKYAPLAASILASAAVATPLIAVPVPAPAHAQAVDPTCAPQGVVRYICTRAIPEDIVRLPGTDWAISSSFSGSMGLRLFSIRQEKEVAILYPSASVQKKQNMTLFSACPGPLSKAAEDNFVSHGLALAKVSDKIYRLYVVAHGLREAIEVFDLEIVPGKQPATTWVGCAVAPGMALLNAVAPLPDNGFAATYSRTRKADWIPPVIPGFREVFGDPNIDSATQEDREKAARGENNGYVTEWHSATGWTKVQGTDAVTNNGLETSPDGKTFYIIAGPKIIRVNRGDTLATRLVADLGYSGDNVKWSLDHKRLIAAVRGPNRTTPKVLFIDPNTLKTTATVDAPGPLTTGYQIDNNIWTTTAPGQRIAILPMPPKP